MEYSDGEWTLKCYKWSAEDGNENYSVIIKRNGKLVFRTSHATVFVDTERKAKEYLDGVKQLFGR